MTTMMQFNKITIIDSCGIIPSVVKKLQTLSKQPLQIYNDYPETDMEIIQRIADSDCVLVSWQTKINAPVLQAAKALKFVAMCCSLYDENSSNVDILEARRLGIDVKGVKEYGDDGTVEFIFAQLIQLFLGLGKNKWRNEPTELKNKSFGIIGLGTLGKRVAETANYFGMQVYYYSRTRKYELENKNLTYLPLQELLQTCDVITTHVPKNTMAIPAEAFSHKKKNSVFINTSLGLPCDKNALMTWLHEDKTSFGIFDADGIGCYIDEFTKLDNVVYVDQYTGFTAEARERLSEKVVENLMTFLRQKKA